MQTRGIVPDPGVKTGSRIKPLDGFGTGSRSDQNTRVRLRNPEEVNMRRVSVNRIGAPVLPGGERPVYSRLVSGTVLDPGGY